MTLSIEDAQLNAPLEPLSEGFYMILDWVGPTWAELKGPRCIVHSNVMLGGFLGLSVMPRDASIFVLVPVWYAVK